MKYGGNMGDLHRTMEASHKTLELLAGISSNVARAIRPMNMAGLGSSSVAYDAMGNVTGGTPQDNVASVVTAPTGNVVTTYTDGTINITNAQGQDVTANYLTSPTMGNPITNALQDVATAAKNVASTATTGLSSVATIAVILGVVFVIYKMESKS
jgi:hypothetical protein